MVVAALLVRNCFGESSAWGCLSWLSRWYLCCKLLLSWPLTGARVHILLFDSTFWLPCGALERGSSVLKPSPLRFVSAPLVSFLKVVAGLDVVRRYGGP